MSSAINYTGLNRWRLDQHISPHNAVHEETSNFPFSFDGQGNDVP